MPRKPRPPLEVEFITHVKAISGHKTNAAFASACGKNPQNVNNYLNGNTVPGRKVLKDCLESLFGWQVKVEAEVKPLPKPLSKITTAPGIYALYDHNFELLYVGQAKNLRAEVSQTLNRTIPGLVGHKIKSRVHYCSLYVIHNPKIRHNIEALIIRIVGHQTYNIDVERFKSA